MAFGFSPKYLGEISLDDITTEQCIVISIETANSLGWEVGLKSEIGFVAYTTYSLSSWAEEFRLVIEDGKAKLKSECTGSQMVDYGKNKRNIESFTEKYNELKNAYTATELESKYAELKPTFTPKDDHTFNTIPAGAKEKISGVFSIFKPVQGYFITPIIIDINIVVFALMCISGVSVLMPDNESLLNWGANFKPLTLDGQWWRLISCIFLHIGIMHLLLNMYALLYIGLLLEPLLGKARFVTAYFLTGIVSSTVSLYWHDLIISAGASGAIFGMYGVFLALLATNIIDKSSRKALLTSTIVFVGYNLANGMKSGVDNAAHIGGLLSGLLIGFAFYPSLQKPQKNDVQTITIYVLSFVILSGTYYVYKHTPNDIGQYDKYMKKFADNEDRALKFYHMPKTTSNDTLIRVLDDEGIKYWNENLALIDEADKLKLPDQLYTKDQKLKEYCNLRIKSYRLIKRIILENEKTDSIDIYNTEIKELIERLKENSTHP